MKKIVLILLFSCLTGPLLAREVVNLNHDWRFALNDEPQASPIDLPHTWNRGAQPFVRPGSRAMGNYTRTVQIPREWAEKRVYIRFYGADSEANLFVNGHYAGEHRGAYAAFTFEITPLLRFGEANSLWMRVSNARQLDYLPAGSDWNSYGGIVRDVELIVVDPVHFALSDHGSDGVVLRQGRGADDEARIDAAVRLEGTRSGTCTVTLDLFDPEQNRVVASASEKIKVDRGRGAGNATITLADPHRWHGTIDPFLYEVRIALKEGAQTLDSLTIPWGVRSFEIDPRRGFLLNGEPYPLHGVTRLEDRSGVGSAYLERMHREDLALIREMGANAVRTYGSPASPRFYELCDRAGIIVWSEIPLAAPQLGVDNGFVDKPAFRENGRQQLTEMILQHGNRASVFFWGLFSNLSGRGTDDPLPYITELNRLAHELDPSRPTVAASNQDGAINFVTDAIGWSQYLGWQGGAVADIDLWLGQLTRDWGHLRSAVAEYGAGGSTAHQPQELSRPDPQARLHPERWQTRYHEQFYAILRNYPAIWGGFIHSMFDFGAENYPGGDTPGIDDRGLISYDRREKKDAFYFYKANWNPSDPFVHIAEKRWDKRSESTQTLTVYTNRPDAELFVDGVSQGSRSAVLGICRWENVELAEGENRVEVRSGALSDTARIVVSTSERRL